MTGDFETKKVIIETTPERAGVIKAFIYEVLNDTEAFQSIPVFDIMDYEKPEIEIVKV